jgi:hypothetical protein
VKALFAGAVPQLMVTDPPLASNTIRNGDIAGASTIRRERVKSATTRSRIGLPLGICSPARLPMSGMGRSVRPLLPKVLPRAASQSGPRSSGPRSGW